jgi:hypothetical protein
MRRLGFPAVLIMLCLWAGSAFATCPTAPIGPTTIGPNTWTNYTQDQACYSTSNASSSSISCFTEPSWSFGTGTGSASVSFTIGQNDWVGNTSHWTAGSWVDFSSSGGTSSDRFEIDVDVTHPNTTVSHYTVIFHSGLNGSISSCSGQLWNYFTANTGDTVTVTIATNKTSGGNIVVSVPQIFSNYP